MTSAAAGQVCIVTGADETMETLLHGLLQSLVFAGVSAQAHIVVLDFGLSASMRARLAALCDRIVDPKAAPASGALDFIDSRRAVLFYRLLLPDLVPGYDTYLWLDADTWVQGSEMLTIFTEFAKAKDVAIVAETDPSYGYALQRYHWTFTHTKELYGQDMARRLAAQQCLNAGVFAARASSRLWCVWLAHIAHWKGCRRQLLNDQIMLNYLISSGELSAYVLPAVYNWVCHAATPKWFMSKGYWARPLFPHTKIEIMHLTSTSRRYSTKVKVRRREMTVDLSYATAMRLRALASKQPAQKPRDA